MAKIFLVDDDMDLLAQNKVVLENEKHQVVTAGTAKEAIEKLKNYKPDVMVVDVMMEYSTAGFALAREIGKNHPNIPIIILSGASDKENWLGEENDTWESIVRFLDKPVSPAKLVKTVMEVLS
jgi:DNA-binding NtrC family response regulator